MPYLPPPRCFAEPGALRLAHDERVATRCACHRFHGGSISAAGMAHWPSMVSGCRYQAPHDQRSFSSAPHVMAAFSRSRLMIMATPHDRRRRRHGYGIGLLLAEYERRCTLQQEAYGRSARLVDYHFGRCAQPSSFGSRPAPEASPTSSTTRSPKPVFLVAGALSAAAACAVAASAQAACTLPCGRIARQRHDCRAAHGFYRCCCRFRASG